MTAIINDAAPGDWIMGLLSGLQSLSFDRESSTGLRSLLLVIVSTNQRYVITVIKVKTMPSYLSPCY